MKFETLIDKLSDATVEIPDVDSTFFSDLHTLFVKIFEIRNFSKTLFYPLFRFVLENNKFAQIHGLIRRSVYRRDTSKNFSPIRHSKIPRVESLNDSRLSCNRYAREKSLKRLQVARFFDHRIAVRIGSTTHRCLDQCTRECRGSFSGNSSTSSWALSSTGESARSTSTHFHISHIRSDLVPIR